LLSLAVATAILSQSENPLGVGWKCVGRYRQVLVEKVDTGDWRKAGEGVRERERERERQAIELEARGCNGIRWGRRFMRRCMRRKGWEMVGRC
jgi:hypothetical protein